MTEEAPKSRYIPDKYLPFVEQSMLNLALRGYTVTTDTGSDMTASLLDQADRINTEYEKALKRLAPKTTPRPKAQPKVSPGKP